MRILITTGIYPPRVGGPAQYAKNLKESFEAAGHRVMVRTYGIEHWLPTGIRHLYFFCKIAPAVIMSDYIISLDTFSVGFPSVLAAKLFGKRIVIRTGGDFLWEGYVERTGDLVLLRDFYTTTKEKWNGKERMIFKVTRWTLRNVSKLVFSTAWQQDIFSKAYDLPKEKSTLIENFYGPKLQSFDPVKKDFLAFTRPLKWKNLNVLQRSFSEAKKTAADLELDMSPVPYEAAMEKMQRAYAIILVSLGDISPNMILDAIRYNKPFIFTRENGIHERIKDIGIFVDPKDRKDIKEKILWLGDPVNYDKQKKKVEDFNFVHTWEEIRDEFIREYNSLL